MHEWDRSLIITQNPYPLCEWNARASQVQLTCEPKICVIETAQCHKLFFSFTFDQFCFRTKKKNWTKIKKIQNFLVLNVEISEWQFTLKINPHFTTRRPKKTKQNKTKSNGVEQWFLVSTGKTDLAKKIIIIVVFLSQNRIFGCLFIHLFFLLLWGKFSFYSFWTVSKAW